MNFLTMGVIATLSTLLVACTAPNALTTKTQSNGEMSVKTRTNNTVLLTEIGIDRVNMINIGDLKKIALGIRVC